MRIIACERFGACLSRALPAAAIGRRWRWPKEPPGATDDHAALSHAMSATFRGPESREIKLTLEFCFGFCERGCTLQSATSFSTEQSNDARRTQLPNAINFQGQMH